MSEAATMLLRIRHRISLSRPRSKLLPVRRWLSSSRGGDGRLLRIEPEVKLALDEGRPVVALESTIISHGMPYPENLAMARGVEAIIRDRGAVPATVAVLQGRPHVGLTAPQLESLAEAGPRARKCSRRDLAVAIAQGVDGATTVAATSYLASLAGVKVFVTGGMGGVHRGAETTFDVSADLAELARTPIVVVCAGVKSILDIEKTLEVLETNGVPVISYGTDDFPAFFSPSSGLPSPLRLNTPSEVAKAAKAAFDLGMRNGMILAVPNPSPMSGGGDIDAAIRAALEDADKRGLKGRDVTPFVLASVSEATGGHSLKSNVALVRHNAGIGADIAVQLAALSSHPPPAPPAHTRGANKLPPPPPSREPPSSRSARAPEPSGSRDQLARPPPPRVAVFGGAVADIVSKPSAGTALAPGTSSPGETRQSFGGVGRNVAEGIARVLGVEGRRSESGIVNGENGGGGGGGDTGRAGVTLVSVVGADDAGKALVSSCEEYGVDAAGTVEVGHPGHAQVGGGGGGGGGNGAGTASYVAVLGGDGDLVAAVADMRIFERMRPDFVERHAGVLGGAAVAVADGNLPPAGFARLAELCAQRAIPLVFEPTSVAKCTVPFLAGSARAITLVTPNLDELAAMSAAASGNKKEKVTSGGLREGHSIATEALARGKLVDYRPLRPALTSVLDAMLEADSERTALLDGGRHVVLTLGSAGVVLVSARRSPMSSPGSGKRWSVSSAHYPALPLEHPGQDGESNGAVADCTGAGDCLVAGMVGGFALGWSAHESVCLGLLCARQSVSAHKAVPESLGTILDHTRNAYSESARHVLSLLPRGYEPTRISCIE